MIKNILIGIAILVIGVAVGRFSGPSKVIEKEHIIYQDKVVDNTVKEKKDNKVYTRVEKDAPDGTRTITTNITDKDVTNVQDVKTDVSSTITDKSKTTTYSKTNTLISGGVNNNGSYSLMVNERILGPFYVGGFLFTDKTYGVSVGISF